MRAEGPMDSPAAEAPPVKCIGPSLGGFAAYCAMLDDFLLEHLQLFGDDENRLFLGELEFAEFFL